MMAAALHVCILFVRRLQLIADNHEYVGPFWQPYTAQRQASSLLVTYVRDLMVSKALIQLNSTNLTMISDDYRKVQMDFINDDPIVWLH